MEMRKETTGKYKLRDQVQEKNKDFQPRRKWPTPTASERSGINPNTGKGEGLSKTVKNVKWPTPTAVEATKITGTANYGTVGLNNHPLIRGLPTREKMHKDRKGFLGKNKPIQTYSTPTTMDSLPPKSEKALFKEATETRPGRSRPGNLRDQICNKRNWATPRSRDEGRWVMNKARQGEKPEDTLTGQVCDEEGAPKFSTDASTKVRLSPWWVEWLMGWPLGWSDIEPINNEDFEFWKELTLSGQWWLEDPAESGEVPRLCGKVPNWSDRIKGIGNGQVPASMVLAWKILTLNLPEL